MKGRHQQLIHETAHPEGRRPAALVRETRTLYIKPFDAKFRQRSPSSGDAFSMSNSREWARRAVRLCRGDFGDPGQAHP